MAAFIRIKILPSALSIFSVKNVVEIEHKYLVKGHTHMVMESMHRQLKHTPIFGPMDYPTVFRAARMTPRPYTERGRSYILSGLRTKMPARSRLVQGMSKGRPSGEWYSPPSIHSGWGYSVQSGLWSGRDDAAQIKGPNTGLSRCVLRIYFLRRNPEKKASRSTKPEICNTKRIVWFVK